MASGFFPWSSLTTLNKALIVLASCSVWGVESIGPRLPIAQFPGNQGLCFQFKQGASRVLQKKGELLIPRPVFSLYDVARNRNCRPSHLADSSVELCFRKVLRDAV